MVLRVQSIAVRDHRNESCIYWNLHLLGGPMSAEAIARLRVALVRLRVAVEWAEKGGALVVSRADLRKLLDAYDALGADLKKAGRR